MRCENFYRDPDPAPRERLVFDADLCRQDLRAVDEREALRAKIVQHLGRRGL